MALAITPAAVAQDLLSWLSTDTYVGFSTSLGMQRSNASATDIAAALTTATTINTLTVDEEGIGWRLFVGKRIHPYLAVELGAFSMGKIELDMDIDAPDTAALFTELAPATPVAPSGLTATAVTEWSLADLGGRAPWTHQAHLIGRAGLTLWRTKASYDDGTTVFKHKENGVGAHLGIGGGWWFSEQFTVRAEFELFTADTRMRAFQLGVVYNF